MAMKENWTLGGDRTVQYTDDILYSCSPENYIILLTNVKFTTVF